MRVTLTVLVALLVVAHLGFFALEAVFWEADEVAGTRKALNLDDDNKDVVAKVARVGKNQGLCNAFLAAGLAWGVWGYRQGRPEGEPVLTFFLGFIVLAGLVGYWSLGPAFPTALGFLVGQSGLAAAAVACLRTRPAGGPGPR